MRVTVHSVMATLHNMPIEAPSEKSLRPPYGSVWLPVVMLLDQPWEERIQCICCHSCCSQERMNVSAVLPAPWVFFQLPSSHLAYHGFSEQCTSWNTVRQHPSLIFFFKIAYFWDKFFFRGQAHIWLHCLGLYIKCGTWTDIIKRLLEIFIITKSPDNPLKFMGRWSELFGDLEV